MGSSSNERVEGRREGGKRGMRKGIETGEDSLTTTYDRGGGAYTRDTRYNRDYRNGNRRTGIGWRVHRMGREGEGNIRSEEIRRQPSTSTPIERLYLPPYIFMDFCQFFFRD